MDNELLHGYMDYVAIGTESIILIDFKSDQNVSDSELHQRYDEQLHAYQSALAFMYPTHKIYAYLYSFQNKSMSLVKG